MSNRAELQIGKWGNSLGVRLPKHLLESLHLSPKDRVKYSVEDGKLILEPIHPHKKYTLEALLAEVEERGSDEISWGKSEGEEAW